MILSENNQNSYITTQTNIRFISMCYSLTYLIWLTLIWYNTIIISVSITISICISSRFSSSSSLSVEFFRSSGNRLNISIIIVGIINYYRYNMYIGISICICLFIGSRNASSYSKTNKKLVLSSLLLSVAAAAAAAAEEVLATALSFIVFHDGYMINTELLSMLLNFPGNTWYRLLIINLVVAVFVSFCFSSFTIYHFF